MRATEGAPGTKFLVFGLQFIQPSQLMTLMPPKNFCLALAAFSLLVLAPCAIEAQPANDNFANAWLLSGTSVLTNGTSTGATKQTGEPNHAGLVDGRSVWFNWTAPTGDV